MWIFVICEKIQKLLDAGLDALKTASKKEIHKAAEAKAEFIGNKMADKIVKPKHAIDGSPENVEEIIPSDEREEILNELRQVL